MFVSCILPSACIAVGVVGGTGFGKGKVLAERWNGEMWWVQPVGLRASQSLFWDVSCGSAHFCAATGSVVFGSGSTRPEVRPFVVDLERLAVEVSSVCAVAMRQARWIAAWDGGRARVRWVSPSHGSVSAAWNGATRWVRSD
jgi:hypothetical protein